MSFTAMGTTSWYLAALCCLIILYITYYLAKLLLKSTKLQEDYRGVPSLPISKIPFVGNMHKFEKDPHLFCQLLLRMARETHEQKKDLFCLWYSLWPMIFACTGHSLSTFINHSKQLVKSFDYTFLEPWLKTGLLTSNNAKWRSRRRLITPSFHDTQLLNNFMIIFNEQSQIFAQRLEKRIANGEAKDAFDLYPYVSSCTLDIIAETAMGESVGAQSGDGQNAFVNATARMGSIVNMRIRFPWMWPTFIFDQLPQGKEQAECLKILHGTSRKIIKNRMAKFNSENETDTIDKKSTRRLVFLDSLLAQMNSEKLTLDDIQEEVDTFMFEGHDTTAAAVNFTCYLLASHPEIQARVHAELDSIFYDDKERFCTMQDIQQMVYLEAVIKESMRILPPVPMVIREAQEDFSCNGQIVRKGTTVYIFIYGVHLDPNVFPNPEKFDPERFLDNTIINEERSPYAYVPFSAGSRNCIGQRFASLEEKVVLSTLLRHFSLRTTQTIADIKLCFEAVLRTSVPIKITVAPRECR